MALWYSSGLAGRRVAGTDMDRRPSVRPSAELRTKEPLSSHRPNRVHVTHPESKREEEEEEEHAKRALCTELCRSQANLA